MPDNPGKPDSLTDRLFLHAAEFPAHDAVAAPGSTLSYYRLARLVQDQAEAFVDAGISADSVIGIKCDDDVKHLVFCLSAIYLGATSCAISARETDASQAAMLDRSGITHVIDESFFVTQGSPDQGCGSRPAETTAPDAQLLFSTSGTTGEPKLVVYRDTDLVLQAHRHIASREERFACLASMEHNFVKRHRLYSVAVGATNIFIDNDAARLVDHCLSLAVNVLHVSAYQAQELLAIDGIDRLSAIRLKLGGSHVPLTLRQQLRNRITTNLQAGYGTTETGAISFTDPGDASAGESVGRPLPGLEVRAVDLAGEPLPGGEKGELTIRGAGMFRGYLGNPDQTAARLRGGWFHTGDIGYLDDRQRIHLCGRSDDMFVFNSMNIYPQDIEAQICQYPGVVDAAVVPKSSPVHGDIPVALVAFADEVEPDLATLEKFVRQRLGARSPRQYTVVGEIPRNLTGKIDRGQAKSISGSADQIRGFIVQALDSCETFALKPSQIAAFESGDEDIELEQLGMDSLARMNLLVALEVEHDLVITPQEFGQFETLGDIVSNILSQPHQTDGDSKSRSPLAGSKLRGIDTGDRPYIVRVFQRVFGICQTVAQLDKAIATLEWRLTPMDFEYLREWHLDGRLIPPDAAEKFHNALSHWIEARHRTLQYSGKRKPEPFVLHRIAPTAIHCVGPGSRAEKSLLVCFATRGSRQLSISTAALMQHTDSARYDLLVITEPLNEGYRLGVPFLGNNMAALIEWIGNLDMVRSYGGIRTLGASAGGYPSMIAGYLLHADVAVCVGGRFDLIRKPVRILEKIFTTWRAIRKGRCARLMLVYSADEPRDRNFVKFMAGPTKASSLAIKFSDARAGHGVLTQLLRRGELAPFLQHTLFIGMDDESSVPQRESRILTFPTLELRPYS